VLPAPRLYPALWLAAFAPVSALVVSDLAHDVVRPVVWAARFLPTVLALAPVGWATFSSAPGALHLRKELRLLAPWAIWLLMTTSAALTADAQAPLWARGTTLLSAVLSVPVLAAVLVVLPWASEQRLGTLQATLQATLTSPRLARTALEKSALPAWFVTLAWLQLCGLEPLLKPEQPRWMLLSVFLLIIAVGPTWFFALRHLGLALIAAIFVPALLAVLPELPSLWDRPWAWADPTERLTLAAYGLTMLALTPRVLRGGLARPPPIADQALHGRSHPLLNRLPPTLRVEAHLMLAALAVSMTTPVSALVFRVLSITSPENDPVTQVSGVGLGLFCAALAPALSIAEAEHLGLLAQSLALHRRRDVFRTKALASLTVSLVGGLVIPGLTLVASEGLHWVSASYLRGWLLAVVLAWAVSLAVSTVQSGAGSALGIAAGLGVGAVSLQLGAFGLGGWLMTRPDFARPVPAFVVAALAPIAAVAVGLAWRVLVAQRSLTPRALAWCTTLLLAHAAVLGAIGAALRGTPYFAS
jgi:hypothetical protein